VEEDPFRHRPAGRRHLPLQGKEQEGATWLGGWVSFLSRWVSDPVLLVVWLGSPDGLRSPGSWSSCRSPSCSPPSASIYDCSIADCSFHLVLYEHCAVDALTETVWAARRDLPGGPRPSFRWSSGIRGLRLREGCRAERGGEGLLHTAATSGGAEGLLQAAVTLDGGEGLLRAAAMMVSAELCGGEDPFRHRPVGRRHVPAKGKEHGGAAGSGGACFWRVGAPCAHDDGGTVNAPQAIVMPPSATMVWPVV